MKDFSEKKKFSISSSLASSSRETRFKSFQQQFHVKWFFEVDHYRDTAVLEI